MKLKPLALSARLAITPIVLNLANIAWAEQHTIDKEQMLLDYFAQANVCSTSSIVAISEKDTGVVISLAIEPTTKNGLQRMDTNNKNNWFSLHCPPESHQVWNNLSEQQDIFVQGNLTKETNYQLACSAFYSEQYSKIKKHSLSIQARIRQLLLLSD